MGDPMELPGEGSQLGNGTPEGEELVFGQRAETSEMGSDEHSGVRRRAQSPRKGASPEQQRVLSAEAHVKTALPGVSRSLLWPTAVEDVGLGWQCPNGNPSEPRRGRNELSRSRGLDTSLDVRGHGRV